MSDMELLNEVKYKSILSYVPKKYHNPSNSYYKENAFQAMCDSLKKDNYTIDEVQTMINNLKEDRCLEDGASMSERVVLIAYKQKIFSGLANSNTSLVPVPTSSKPLEYGLDVPECIAKAMAEKGLGKVERCLKRTKFLPKSAGSETRPTAKEHYESMTVSSLVNLDEIVLVDDVVTKGSIILGAASKLKKAFPKSKISAFVVVRALYLEDFEHVVCPHEGVIRREGEDATKD